MPKGTSIFKGAGGPSRTTCRSFFEAHWCASPSVSSLGTTPETRTRRGRPGGLLSPNRLLYASGTRAMRSSRCWLRQGATLENTNVPVNLLTKLTDLSRVGCRHRRIVPRGASSAPYTRRRRNGTGGGGGVPRPRAFPPTPWPPGRPTRRFCAFGGQRGRPCGPDLPARPWGERKDEMTSLPKG